MIDQITKVTISTLRDSNASLTCEVVPKLVGRSVWKKPSRSLNDGGSEIRMMGELKRHLE